MVRGEPAIRRPERVGIAARLQVPHRRRAVLHLRLHWSRHVSELLPAAGRELMVAWMPQLPQVRTLNLSDIPEGRFDEHIDQMLTGLALFPGACHLPLGARAERQLVLLGCGGRARRNAGAVHRGLALHRWPGAGDGGHVKHPVVLVR